MPCMPCMLCSQLVTPCAAWLLQTAKYVERDGRWHHLAVTWSVDNAGLTKIYWDGLLSEGLSAARLHVDSLSVAAGSPDGLLCTEHAAVRRSMQLMAFLASVCCPASCVCAGPLRQTSRQEQWSQHQPAPVVTSQVLIRPPCVRAPPCSGASLHEADRAAGA